MGDWIARNLGCFECGSSDAMQESEHHYKCFSCGEIFLKRDHGQPKENKKVSIPTNLITPGGFYNLESRKITKETTQKYKITCTKYTGSFGHGDNLQHVSDHWVYVFNKYVNGALLSQKIRSCEDKKLMKIVGDTSNKELFGQQLWTPNPQRFVVICEGEFDAATVYQEGGFSAVSVLNGAESAVSNIRNNIDWLSKWAYVVLALDNDKAGQEATQKVIEAGLFEPGKLRLVYWPLKDPNELLLAARSADLKKSVWDAEEYRPKDIFDSADCLELALVKPKQGHDTPWRTLTDSLKGWPMNCIVTIAAADGIGKTEIAEEIVYSLIKQKQKVWLYSCEQDRGEILLRLAGKALEIPLHIPGAKWDEVKISEEIMKTDGYLKIWEPERALTTDALLDKMKYCTIAYGVKYFLIDHLKGVESQLADPVKGVGKFMNELKIFAQTYDICVILLSHVAKHTQQSKPGQKADSWNRGRVPDKENIHGSSAISAWSNIIVVASRNVEADDPYEACITKLSILKNRLMGNRGSKYVYLQYIEDTGRLLELPSADYEAYFEDEDND